MIRSCQPSLRWRLCAGALGLGLLTITGAGIAILGLAATERRAQDALAAQSRLEAWSSLSTRLNEWMLLRLTEGNAAPEQGRIDEALRRLEILTAEDVAHASSSEEASKRAAEIRHVAKVRSFFKQLSITSFRTPTGEAALRFHMTHAPVVVRERIEHEIRRRDAALASMKDLRQPLTISMVALALAAPLLLLVLWRSAFQPLLVGLRRASAEAASLTNPPYPGKASHTHDELGLVFARMRHASARIARRRARLESDISALETTVANRTAELIGANTRLAAIDASRRRFFEDVSHELRTPLTVILGEAELGSMSPDAETRESFATIQARAQRLFLRIEDLLRIARSESGQLELQPQSVRLADLIERARTDVAQLIRRNGMKWVADIPSEIDVLADPDWLRQILSGTLENSVKFAGPDETISISAAIMGGMVNVIIHDSGKRAIPAPDNAIFDRYARHSEAKTSGFGIGLALARWVARESGGDLIRLSTNPGFTLQLSLPLAPKAQDGTDSDR